MRRGRRGARGFSLVELAVAVAVSAIVIAAGVALLLATQRTFQGGVDERAMQETARVALDEIGTSLRQAGYGLEPTFAFDFGQAPTLMDRAPPGQAVQFGDPALCADPVTCRDRTDGPDELLFYARDPDWGYDLQAVSGTQLTLANPDPGRRTISVQRGQILQVMCYGNAGGWLWAYVTAGADASANTASVAVQLASGGTGNDFPLQNGFLGQACFSGGQRRVFRVDRLRYYVAAVDAAGNVQAWETAGTRPYLMLDRGLSGGPQPIAPDVEDLQVAYVFPLSATPVAGATPGTRLAAAADGIDLAPAVGIPSLSTPTLDALRTTHHPANIRAVRVAITVRSPRQELTIPEDVVPASLNRTAVPGEPGYRRTTFEVTTRVRNMENTLPLFPRWASDGFATASQGGG